MACSNTPSASPNASMHSVNASCACRPRSLRVESASPASSQSTGSCGHGRALRYFCVDGTDHPTHAEQASIIRWRNNNATDKALNDIVNRANVC